MNIGRSPGEAISFGDETAGNMAWWSLGQVIFMTYQSCVYPGASARAVVLKI
jgi:hypothetical protein